MRWKFGVNMKLPHLLQRKNYNFCLISTFDIDGMRYIDTILINRASIE